jgi:hypothetical protein
MPRFTASKTSAGWLCRSHEKLSRVVFEQIPGGGLFAGRFLVDGIHLIATTYVFTRGRHWVALSYGVHPCHPEPFVYAQDKLREGSPLWNGYSPPRFFAALRMTRCSAQNDTIATAHRELSGFARYAGLCHRFREASKGEGLPRAHTSEWNAAVFGNSWAGNSLAFAVEPIPLGIVSLGAPPG